MARIPMSHDVAELIGHSAEKVENRSLLLDKFTFHKLWPNVQSERGQVKWDEATRWSLIRIADGAAGLLRRDALEKRRKAEGMNIEAENRERLHREAKIAESLAAVSWDSSELASLRARHTRRFLGLFHSTSRDRSRALIAKLEGRLAVNLADSLIRNAGIALDRLFGLPYIPGTAVKGVSRAFAIEELTAASGDERERIFDLFRRVFGTADNDFKPDHELAAFRDLLGNRPANLRGAIAFLPAYPVDDAKIVVDLTNVHFPDYYKTGNPSDLQRESPQPNSFPCVEAGVRFAFCLVATGTDLTPDLLEFAERWLVQALTIRGLGAKTAAGYGWFSVEPPEVLNGVLMEEARTREAEANAAKQAVEARVAAEAEANRKAALKPEDRIMEELVQLSDQDFAGKVLTLVSLSTDEQRAILLALNTPAKRDRWKKWKKSDKDTDKKRVSIALELSKKLAIPLP